MCHIPGLTSQDMTEYILDAMAGGWPQQLKFTFPVHLFTHLGFPECPCCLVCDICCRCLLCIWTNDFKLKDDMTVISFLILIFLLPFMTLFRERPFNFKGGGGAMGFFGVKIFIFVAQQKFFKSANRKFFSPKTHSPTP